MVVGSTYSQKVVAPGTVEKPWALAREVLPGNKLTIIYDILK
jgi:hypothetical protein